MSDKKLTDNEVINDLEERIEFAKDFESDFTLIKIEGLKSTLDLINRLQADLKIAENINHLQMEELQSRKAELDEYAKIKTTIDEFWEILLTLSLFKRKEKPTLEEFAEAIQEIKAESYKEFAEEIFKLFPADKSVTYITRVTVKHILKKLMGDAESPSE